MVITKGTTLLLIPDKTFEDVDWVLANTTMDERIRLRSAEEEETLRRMQKYALKNEIEHALLRPHVEMFFATRRFYEMYLSTARPEGSRSVDEQYKITCWLYHSNEKGFGNCYDLRGF